MARHHMLAAMGLMMGLSIHLQVSATESLSSVAPPASTKNPTSSETASKISKSDGEVGQQDSLRMATLLADGFNTIEKMAVERQRLSEEQLEAERLESLKYPAVELYGENSWGGYVNPFAGNVSAAKIPDKYDIDCSGFVMPLDGNVRITSSYGYRRRYRRMHRGIDLKLSTGDTVRAAFDGKVRINDYEGRGYGHYLVLRHDNGLETVYGHLSKKLVKRDEIVKAGDPIGLGGSTGRSTGPHLHFETRFMGIDINPALIFDFNEKVPLRDVYTFKRNGKSSSSRGVQYSSAKNTGSHKVKAPVMHRIRQGDNLWDIAKKYGTTVTKLCQLNNMSRRATLKIGKSIRVR